MTNRENAGALGPDQTEIENIAANLTEATGRRYSRSPNESRRWASRARLSAAEAP